MSGASTSARSSTRRPGIYQHKVNRSSYAGTSPQESGKRRVVATNRGETSGRPVSRGGGSEGERFAVSTDSRPSAATSYKTLLDSIPWQPRQSGQMLWEEDAFPTVKNLAKKMGVTTVVAPQ